MDIFRFAKRTSKSFQDFARTINVITLAKINLGMELLDIARVSLCAIVDTLVHQASGGVGWLVGVGVGVGL
ncbi:hypothetical protein QVD17_41157 [Tagetes erecta]|uniref:Uncharacterized protein n=1 Tax=Tagetes erecta TaxID=13708 RepID=A0AAD8JQV2_TARER|nr:hypothetical protein QVD17_41157 [Tagetes erecta]